MKRTSSTTEGTNSTIGRHSCGWGSTKEENQGPKERS